MLRFKISTCSISSEENILNNAIQNLSLEIEVSKEDFNDKLGKALYGVELLGFSFVTAEVYDSIMRILPTIKLNKTRFVTVYTDDVVTVQMKEY